ncbi:hypothetical protein [Halorientalis sp.]|uniref:hypothetical protein n=1 Tax=Halorientalis sp. TaxID=1931229 RepID=UPI00262D2AA7|nr:hypothetical protein [Halorientalis sp.]
MNPTAEVNVVRPRAEHLAEDGLTGTQRENVTVIRTTAEPGTEARQAARAMETVSTELAAIRGTLRAAVGDATADAEHTTVTVDVPPDLLDRVFTSVVENAVEHTHGDSSAAIAATEVDGRFRAQRDHCGLRTCHPLLKKRRSQLWMPIASICSW